MPPPLHKRLLWEWNYIRRQLRHTVWIPSVVSLAAKRLILRLCSPFADTSRDRFITPDLTPEVQPRPQQDQVTVSKTLGEVCRLRWPSLHLDLHFHFFTSSRRRTRPKELFATINVSSVRDLTPSLIDLHVYADGKTMTISGEAIGLCNPGDAHVSFLFPFPTDVLDALATAKSLQFELEGLRFPIGSNAKKAIRHLISYEVPELPTVA